MTGPADGAVLDACRDPDRLQAFAPYDILDTPREAEYDDLVKLAAQICNTPIAVVNLVLADRQWFKAEVGLGLCETELDISICRQLLLTPGLTVVPDTRADPRLAANPLVAGEPGLRFYAGHLLQTPAGMPLGTLCVLDHEPRPDLEPDQRFALAALARQVMTQFELRRALRDQRSLLAQKDLLFQELSHRVKNSLQIIASLIQLQSTAAHDAGTQTLLAETRNRVLTVAKLHEQLYLSQEVREVELGGYLRTLLGVLEMPARQGDVAVELRIEASGTALLPTDRAVQVALIVNELVTNAIKYAHPSGHSGTILVRVEPGERGAHRVHVEDDGVGLPAGFDPYASASLGMRIVTGLAHQLQAVLDWSGDKGARFRLDLPPDDPAAVKG
jgi:two-component sensor histidine kinase